MRNSANADSNQLDFLRPLVCESDRQIIMVGMIADRCRSCGRGIARHRDTPAWVNFICVWCFVGEDHP